MNGCNMETHISSISLLKSYFAPEFVPVDTNCYWLMMKNQPIFVLFSKILLHTSSILEQ